MVARFGKLFAAVALLTAVWSLSLSRGRTTESWVRPAGTAPGPVRILQFYSSVGSIKPGETALLCYGVENAKTVRIAPLMQGEAPSTKRCLEVAPVHTTHYTILAEGFDGHLAMQSLTLPVDTPSPAPLETPHRYAMKVDNRAPAQGALNLARASQRFLPNLPIEKHRQAGDGVQPEEQDALV